MTIPNFVASVHDDDEFWCTETGDTIEEARDNLAASPQFASYCSSNPSCNPVTVYVHQCVLPEKSSWPEDERDPSWKWCAESIGVQFDVDAVEESRP